jgi:predicted transcriptional regulator
MFLNMKKSPAKTKTMKIVTDEQRRAIASPLRLELIGLFVDDEPLSVVQIAERMGRPATAIHYHVRLLVEAGILRRAGQRRSGRRPEALYEPAAGVFMMDPSTKESWSAAGDAAVKTLATAFRMAERDLKAALGDPGTRTAGPGRNMYGTRMHLRLARKDLAELNRHLRGIEKLLLRVHKTHKPSKRDSFVSLTLALMPLRNREVQ